MTNSSVTSESIRSELSDTNDEYDGDDDEDYDDSDADRLSEKSYNGLFTKRDVVDVFLFIQFAPLWLLIVAISIAVMFLYKSYQMMFVPITEKGFEEGTLYAFGFGTCALIQILDFVFIVSHKIMKQSAKRRCFRSIPTVFIILDFAAIGIIFSHYAPGKVRLAIFGVMIRFYRLYCYFYYSIAIDFELNFGRSINRFTVSIIFIFQISIIIWKYINSDARGKVRGLSPLASEFQTLNRHYYNLTWTETANYEYLLCVFYTAGAFTRVGYGFVRNKKLAEHLYISIIALTSVVFLCIFVAINVNGLVESYRRQCTYWYKLKLVLKYITHRTISKKMRKQILRSYQTFWVKERGETMSELFDGLPEVTRKNIMLDIYWTSLTKAHLFGESDALFLRSIAFVMKTTIYYKDAVIYKQGELIMSYFYVAWGSIRILSAEDTETTLITLGMGSCLGGFTLLYSYNTNVQIVADSYCVIHSLNKRDFWKEIIGTCRIEGEHKFKDFFKERLSFAKRKQRRGQ